VWGKGEKVRDTLQCTSALEAVPRNPKVNGFESTPTLKHGYTAKTCLSLMLSLVYIYPELSNLSKALFKNKLQENP